MKLETVIQSLEKDFGAEAKEMFGEVELTLSSENIIVAAQKLRDEFDFAFLSTITAVDYFPEETPRYHVIYVLRSLSENLQLTLRVPVEGNNPSIPTLTEVYKNANWRERELWDMFGIKVEGHPDLRRILMPDDWEGHPLRKDYPLGAEEPQFSFNFEEIDVSKPHGEF